MYKQLKEDPKRQLRNLQQNILIKLQKLSNLNQQFRTRQQRYFLKVFLNVMDKMSSQLKTAQENFRNIDMEIQKDKQCFDLSTKLIFFKNQCIQLRKQLLKTEQQLQSQKKKQKQINKQKQFLQACLYKKSKQLLKYKARAKSLKFKTESGDCVVSVMANQQRKINKNSSTAETKNTKILQNNERQQRDKQVQIINIQKQQEQDFRKTFRAKAEKMVRQHKFILNKTYSSDKSNLDRKEKKNFLTIK